MINLSINTNNVNFSLHLNLLYAFLDGAIVHFGREFTLFAANNFWQGAAFGGIAMLTNFIAHTALAKMGIENDAIRLILAHSIGGAAAFGATVGLASLGVMAAPISVPGAIILTICNLSFDILFLACRSRYY